MSIQLLKHNFKCFLYLENINTLKKNHYESKIFQSKFSESGNIRELG